LEDEVIKKSARLALSFVFFLFCTTAPAQESGLLGDIKSPQQASEYIYRSSPRESLISVQLLGAVHKPGIYYVPANTDLLKLLTLAGGNTDTGKLSEVLVRKTEPQSWLGMKTNKAIGEYQGAYEIDVEKILKYGGGKGLKLQQDDFVYVPAKQPWISEDVSRTATVISVIVGIVLTSVIIQRDQNR
jgi:competence protein ComEA